MIREIGRRTRLKNREVQVVVEALIEVWTEGLIGGGRIELENLFVLETQRLTGANNAGALNGSDAPHSHLKQIREQGQRTHDVVVKHVPATKYIGIRTTSSDWESNLQQWNTVTRLLMENSENRYGNFMGILHADGTATDDFNMEIGRILKIDSPPPLQTRDGQPFTVRELPACELATFIQKGAPYALHIGFSARGAWDERNNYAFVGPMRGIILHPVHFQDTEDMLVDAQFPAQKRDVAFDLLNSRNPNA